MDMLIGLSVSFCIRDILNKKVSLDQVLCIVGATKMAPDKLEEVIDTYTMTYWRNDPRGGEILHELYLQGKLIQPRLSGLPPVSIAHGHWAKVLPR